MADVTTEMRHATMVLRRVAESLSSIRILKSVGYSIEQQAAQNAHERPGRSFWRKMGDSVNTRAGTNFVEVGATHEAAAQKQFGGVISAPGKGPGSLNAKMLTIPVNEAREKRWTTRDALKKFDLFQVKTKGGKALLFGKKREGKSVGKRRKKKPATLLFVLRKSVSQLPEPWFPDGNQLSTAISRGIDDYLKGGI